MQKIFLTALVAGLAAGLFSFGIQAAKLSPLILHAEVYEEEAAKQETTLASHAHDHGDEEAWEPENGFERNGWRAVADLAVGLGYALMLVGAFALRGEAMNTRRGVAWGIAGFAVFALAPGFGLPPELPGTLSADLGARQMWWLATAGGTATGIALLAFSRSPWINLLGVIVLVLPQLVGAPHPHQLGGSVPPELNAEFAAASLASAAAFWIVLGAVGGWFYGRQVTPATAR